jgi:Bacterial Ig domain
VWYDIGGTASNGVDYAAIPPNIVTIPAGATSSTIVITPTSSLPPDAVKTVVLTLTNAPTLNPVNYEIGSPSSATVYLAGSGVTNMPPAVDILEPSAGDVFYTPTNILLVAKAVFLTPNSSNPGGSVTNVEFFAGTNDLGPGAMVVLDPPGINGITGPVWILTWLNPTPGGYPLTAVATDNDGLSATSAPVNISLLQGPPTNQPPVVRIISPANGSIFRAPINIPLFAFANDPEGAVSSVEFFDGTNSLGFGQPIPVPAASPVPPVYPTNIFFLIWSNVPVGNHVLTAQATIVFTNHPIVLVTVSGPVNITVLPPVPPPTNGPPIVNIVASDPVAIEGTNCWIWPGETNATPTWAAWPTAVCRLFTNCGPKTATFTVRRFGDTNDDLTVPYDIGGTASNGVDYVTLPGSVTIPAGERRALISIVPIDDGPPDVNKTVVLTLLPDMQMNPLPGYVLGFPQRAAVIIIDQGPCPTTGKLPDGCFHLAATGPDAAWFSIECSTNLTGWTPVCTNQVINGSIDFVDPDAQANPSRFYRAVPLTSPPTD